MPRLEGARRKDVGTRDPRFSIDTHTGEYAAANDRDETFIGKFILAALAQKSMVTGKIYRSGNRLAGISVSVGENGFRGIGAYLRLSEKMRKEGKK